MNRSRAADMVRYFFKYSTPSSHKVIDLQIFEENKTLILQIFENHKNRVFSDGGTAREARANFFDFTLSFPR